MKGLDMIAADALDTVIQSHGIYLIDLRSCEEYKAWHIAGAHNIPYAGFDRYSCLPRSHVLVLYCDRGAASLAKGRELAAQGFRVLSVTGGVQAYRRVKQEKKESEHG
ncbi:MAG: rhodanese-like domain-containing protein [Lachnospiraceae bacterium]|nr:rhodanese-like domain-containing protein [Lachnospiraceae bacterium]